MQHASEIYKTTDVAAITRGKRSVRLATRWEKNRPRIVPLSGPDLLTVAEGIQALRRLMPISGGISQNKLAFLMRRSVKMYYAEELLIPAHPQEAGTQLPHPPASGSKKIVARFVVSALFKSRKKLGLCH